MQTQAFHPYYAYCDRCPRFCENSELHDGICLWCRDAEAKAAHKPLDMDYVRAQIDKMIAQHPMVRNQRLVTTNPATKPEQFRE